MRFYPVNDLSRLTVSGRLKFLFNDSFLYGGAAALNKAFGLLTFPLVARHFSVQEYGVIDYFSIVATFLSILLIFGQDSAVARFFYEFKDEPTRKQIISQSLLIQLLMLLFVLPLLYWITYSDNIATIFLSESGTPQLLRLIVIQIPFSLLINFTQNLLKWTFSRKEFLIISIGSVIVNTLMLIVAIFFFQIDVYGVFVVRGLALGFFAMLGVFFIRHWLTIPHDCRYFRDLLFYALPLGLICVLGALVPVLERSLISSILGPQMLGLFAAGTKIAMLTMILTQAFQTAWGPFSLALHKEPEAIETYNLVLKGFALFICIMALLLSMFAYPALMILAGERYVAAAIIVFPLSLSLAIQAIGWISEIGIGLSKKTYYSLVSYTVYVLSTIGAVWFFGNQMGFLGVSLGVLLGHASKSIVASWISYRIYPLKWNFMGPLIIVFVTAIGGMVSVLMAQLFGNLTGTFTFVFALLVLVIFSWFKALSIDERVRIRTYFSRYFPSLLKGC